MISDNGNVFIAKLEKLSKLINSRTVNDRLARKCRQIVYRRVKNGYGVVNDTLPAELTRQSKLKPLSPSYVAYREGKVSFFRAKNGRIVAIDQASYGKKNIGGKNSYKTFAPTLGPFGRPRKSNATFTGEMLESIYMRYSTDGFQIVIADNKRKDDSGLTNKQVNDLYSLERPYFALTAGEIRILTRELERIIKDLIQRSF